MCGRYGRTTSAETYAKMLDAQLSQRLEDTVSYNRPPGTFQLCALHHPDTGELTLGPAWWGFLPNWATDTKLSPINARSETAHEKKLFAKAFQRQRCLIAADWWFEWQRGGEQKQAYAIRPSPENPFFFAGIWSKAARLPEDHAAAGQVSFAILTGEPNDDIAHIHNRQPQALTLEAAQAWLSPDETEPEALHAILIDGRLKQYDNWPIEPAVGSPANDDASILEPTSV
jgi:putative SOS response-associated peptidase YedK